MTQYLGVRRQVRHHILSVKRDKGKNVRLFGAGAEDGKDAQRAKAVGLGAQIFIEVYATMALRAAPQPRAAVAARSQIRSRRTLCRRLRIDAGLGDLAQQLV